MFIERRAVPSNRNTAYLPKGNLDTLFGCLFYFILKSGSHFFRSESVVGQIGAFANEHYAYVMVHLLYESPHPSIRGVMPPSGVMSHADGHIHVLII